MSSRIDVRKSITERPVILASRSEARSQLMREAGYTFSVVVTDIDERPLPQESAKDYVRRLAREKAKAVTADSSDAIIIAADTIVLFEHTIIGKPRDAHDARAMLQKLSGKWHEVMTGVVVRDTKINIFHDAVVTSRVRFHVLTDKIIEAYVATGEPLTRAGAYALQGKGECCVAEIIGSRTNVIGLPMTTLSGLLKAMYFF